LPVTGLIWLNVRPFLKGLFGYAADNEANTMADNEASTMADNEATTMAYIKVQDVLRQQMQ